MDLQQLKIACPSGVGQQGHVELDGKDISRGLRGVDLRINVGDFVTATLDLLYVGGEFEGQAKMIIPEETQALLKRLGWTPPADA